MSIDELLSYSKVTLDGLMNLLVFILLIVVVVKIMKKELAPGCKKGFSKFFIAFLVFLMFSTFFDFAYSLTDKIMYDLLIASEIDFYDFYYTMNIVWGVTYGLSFLNQFIAYILLFSAIEFKLLNKKTKFKFLIFAIIFLVGIFLFTIAIIILSYTIGGMGYQISRLVLGVLTSFNYIIIAIAIRVLLKKTGKENESLKVYTKSISIGVLLLLNFNSIIHIFQNVRIFLSDLFDLYGYFDYNALLNMISYGLFFLSSIIFIIGIIVLTMGAIKTMSVPLAFAKEKGTAKKIPRKTARTCSQCDAPITPGSDFCTNCGNHF